MIKFLKKNLKKIGIAMLSLGMIVIPMVSKAADFDATDTTSIVTTAVGAVSPTLKAGIILVLGIGLGVWAVFFLVGKLKKHVK